MSTADASDPIGDRRSPAWGRLVWGLALLGVGCLWLLDTTGILNVTPVRVIALALIALGVVVPFMPTHEHGGVIGVGIVLTVLAVATVVVSPAVDPTLLRRGAGDVNVAPASAEQLRGRYEHGVGDLTVDLRHVALPAGTTRTSVRLGAGQLRVRLPDDVSARVRASAGIGDVVVVTETRSGIGAALNIETRGSSTERWLDLDAAVGAGRIEVTR